MGAPFSDISLYAETKYKNDTPEYWEETSLQNYISDLYISKMHGYKPPNTTRVSINPAYHKIWNRTWTDGSLKLIAPEFNYEKYLSLDTQKKYLYVLDIIHYCMIQLSEEYNWDKSVFERAYKEVLENNFEFKIEYPAKTSRDKKKSAKLYLQKTPTVSSLFVLIVFEDSTKSIKLLDKRNWFWYDSVYKIVRSNKWFDNDRFGIWDKSLDWKIYYTIQEDRIVLEKKGAQCEKINIEELYSF